MASCFTWSIRQKVVTVLHSDGVNPGQSTDFSGFFRPVLLFRFHIPDGQVPVGPGPGGKDLGLVGALDGFHHKGVLFGRGDVKKLIGKLGGMTG